MWEYYFGNDPKNVYSSGSFLSGGSSYFVTKSHFKDLNDQGAIRFSNTDSSTYLLVHACSFTSCSANNYDGGAIYFAYEGKVVQIMNTAYNCSVNGTQYGHYCHISSSDLPDYFNFVLCCSITNCGKSNTGSYSVNIEDGKINISCTNISMNSARSMSAFDINSPDIDSHVKYCTISDNINDDIGLIMINSVGHTAYIQMTNIINNNCKTSFVIYSAEFSNLIISNSSIIGNIKKNNLNNDSGNISISNSYLDEMPNAEIDKGNNVITSHPIIFQTNFCLTRLYEYTKMRKKSQYSNKIFIFLIK